MKTTEEKETKAEDIKESENTKPSDLSHFKDQFEELSIKDLKLVKEMLATTLDLKTAQARHEGKVKKEKTKDGMVMPSSLQYAEPQDDYI